MHLGDAATLNLTLIFDQLRSELRAHQQNMRFNRDRPSEWQSRISRQEESWDETKNVLLDTVISNQSIPHNNVSTVVNI